MQHPGCRGYCTSGRGQLEEEEKLDAPPPTLGAAPCKPPKTDFPAAGTSSGTRVLTVDGVFILVDDNRSVES